MINSTITSTTNGGTIINNYTGYTGTTTFSGIIKPINTTSINTTSINDTVYKYPNTINSNITFDEWITLNPYTTIKYVIPKNEEAKLVPKTEEKIEEYITENFDRYEIQDYGSYIYQIIQDKIYDIAYEVIEEAKEEYIIQNENKIIETIVEEINLNSLYELIDDILNAPITMEEKLADIGISEKDFL